jgi:hypothetical protein
MAGSAALARYRPYRLGPRLSVLRPLGGQGNLYTVNDIVYQVDHGLRAHALIQLGTR